MAALLITLALLAAVLGWSLWRGLQAVPGASQGAATAGLPWDVRAEEAEGTEVFGLSLGLSPLSQLESLWGHDLVVMLIGVPGQPPSLEAYVEGFQAGYVNGKLVAAFQASPEWAETAWQRSPRGRADASSGAPGAVVRRRELAPEDLATARAFKLQALSFVPSARLDEATVHQRFGPPSERWRMPDGSLQLLYPARGVAVALPPAEGEGARARPVIQYVARRDADRLLRAPLQSAGGMAEPAP